MDQKERETTNTLNCVSLCMIDWSTLGHWLFLLQWSSLVSFKTILSQKKVVLSEVWSVVMSLYELFHSFIHCSHCSGALYLLRLLWGRKSCLIRGLICGHGFMWTLSFVHGFDESFSSFLGDWGYKVSSLHKFVSRCVNLFLFIPSWVCVNSFSSFMGLYEQSFIHGSA